MLLTDSFIGFFLIFHSGNSYIVSNPSLSSLYLLLLINEHVDSISNLVQTYELLKRLQSFLKYILYYTCHYIRCQYFTFELYQGFANDSTHFLLSIKCNFSDNKKRKPLWFSKRLMFFQITFEKVILFKIIYIIKKHRIFNIKI